MNKDNLDNTDVVDETTEKRGNNASTLAFIYDLDGTLVDGYLYNQCFDKLLNLDLSAEWPSIVEKSIEFDAIPNMYFTYKLICALKQKVVETGKSLGEIYDECVKNVRYFKGVETWFDNINVFAKEHNVEIQHHIVSAGDKELISRISIAPFIQRIYGNTFIYENGVPIWPANTITAVEKTEYIYRISKGKFAPYDISIYDKSNDDERNVTFENIVYFGDGETDVPSMKLVKNKGGHSIAVYGEDKREIAQKLADNNRVNHIAQADYRKGSELYNYICSLIETAASK